MPRLSPFRMRIGYIGPSEEAGPPIFGGRVRSLWLRAVTFGFPVLVFLSAFFLAGLATNYSPGRTALWLILIGAGLVAGNVVVGAWRRQRRRRLRQRRESARA